MKILCIAGKNNIACDILIIALERLEKDQIVIIPNATDDGSDTWQRSFLKLARQLQVPVVTLEDVYNMEDVVFLSLEFDKIIRTNKFQDAKLYNIHFSLLPKYKGMYTAYWPIICGEHKTGVTLHYIDDGIDTGDIIAQSEYVITDDMTCRDIYLNNISYGTRLVEEYFDRIINGQVESYKQPSAQATYFSKSSISFEDASLDCRQTAYMINNQIRGLRFREYQLATFQDTMISHGEITSDRSTARPGTIIQEDGWIYLIATIDYDIYLYKDRLEDMMAACTNGDVEFLDMCMERGYQMNEVGGDRYFNEYNAE
ncbi:MAG: formyltransferase family protein [Eubacteriales bacterium]